MIHDHITRRKLNYLLLVMPIVKPHDFFPAIQAWSAELLGTSSLFMGFYISLYEHKIIVEHHLDPWEIFPLCGFIFLRTRASICPGSTVVPNPTLEALPSATCHLLVSALGTRQAWAP